MPHSGGGGSHSGGSHSSSHSSGGGSHSRGPSYRASSTPFAGSRTYIVYNNTSSPRVVYSNNPNYQEGVSKNAYYGTAIFCSFFIIPGIIAVLIAIGTFLSAFSFGYKKTKIPDYVNQSIVVSDMDNHLHEQEKDDLIETLTEFRDETGIIPSITFVEDKDWYQDYYGDTENFAYNEYITKFPDEYHLLVVYSYSDVNQDTGFNEYYYHTMWGDDLGKTAKEKDENKLLKLLERNLAIANGKNVGDAFNTTFTEYLSYFKKKTISIDTVRIATAFFGVCWGLVFGGSGLAVLLGTRKAYLATEKDNTKVYEVKGTPTIKKCEYCGRGYVVDENGIPCEQVCRGCGAPLI